MHHYFPGVDCYHDDFILSVTIKDIFFLLKTISFEFFIYNFFSNIMSTLNIFVKMIWSNRWIQFWGIYWILKKCCIICMPDFTHDNDVYVNGYDDIQNFYHDVFFIKEQDPDIIILSPMRFLEEWLKNCQKRLLKTCLFHGY